MLRDWAKTLKEKFPRPVNSKLGPIPIPNPYIRFAKRQPGVPGDAELRELMELVLIVARAISPALATKKPDKVTREKAVLGATGLGLMLQSLARIRRRAFQKNFRGIFAESGLVDTVQFGPLLFPGDKASSVNKIDDAVKAQKRSFYKGSKFEPRGRGYSGYQAKRYPNRGWYRGYQGFGGYNYRGSYYYHPQDPQQIQSSDPQAQQAQGQVPPAPGNEIGRGRPWRARGRGFRGRWN